MAENHEMSEAEGRKKVLSLIKDIKFAMMATYAREGFIHARPMAARHEEDGTLWFLTSRSAHTVDEVRADPRVLLTYAEPSDQHYVSITGSAQLSDDRSRIRELWSEPMRTWFPKGPDDPDIALIRVTPERAQYWDAPSSAVVYAYGYVKARLTGERPSPGEMGKVNL